MIIADLLKLAQFAFQMRVAVSIKGNMEIVLIILVALSVIGAVYEYRHETEEEKQMKIWRYERGFF